MELDVMQGECSQSTFSSFSSDTVVQYILLEPKVVLI
jgi:hypothetical protein